MEISLIVKSVIGYDVLEYAYSTFLLYVWMRCAGARDYVLKHGGPVVAMHSKSRTLVQPEPALPREV